jgi:hypothetical protein
LEYRAERLGELALEVKFKNAGSGLEKRIFQDYN